MANKLKNFRVTVYPKIRDDVSFDDEEMKDICKSLLQEIKKHVNIAGGKIEYDENKS